MSDFFFISYSSVDGKDFAMKLADELVAGPPVFPIWLDKRALRPGEDWDEQLQEAIKTCKGVLFLLSTDSVRPGSVCKNEWVRALKYKKPVLPLLCHRDAELPFRLGSREYIKFTDSFDSGLARLRKHLAWMDSSDGQQQTLKYRLADAQRELPRAEPDQQVRIREDIAELERQIEQQQTAIDNPRATEERVQRSIDAGLEGERRPASPVAGIARGKFINPPPLIAPAWFQDRYSETRQIGEFLKDDALRLMTVVGRGGIGKSAVVCRLLRSLESDQLPDDGGALTVDGIVYLSSARSLNRTSLPDLYAGLTKLLPEQTVKHLDVVYKNPQVTTRATMEALAQAFSSERTVVLLDNFEDMLAVETGEIMDRELHDALCALLELPPHGLKIIITTRIAPGELALVQPGLQRRLDLDGGLEHPYAENILRAMDADGKVGLRAAPDDLLAKARERTLGFPRALEHLFGILSADRDTSLQEILDNTEGLLPEKVVTVLVGEAFSRLDPTAQRVMHALAIYRYPVPPAAVDFLLQPFVSGTNSGRVLSRLVNMQFVHRDSGRYYLHQIDRDYALSRMASGEPDDRGADVPPLTRFALTHRAAEWFKLSRKPRESWKSLVDLAAQLSEFELRLQGHDYDTAAVLLSEFDYSCLDLWGHYRLIIELHERLKGKVTDPVVAAGCIGSLGSGHYRMGQLHAASAYYEQALQLARATGNRSGEAVWLGNLSNCVGDLGQSARAIEYLEQALVIRRELRDLKGEAPDLARLAISYQAIGRHSVAVDYYNQALLIDRELADERSTALDLCNLGACYLDKGCYDDTLRCLTEALGLSRSIGYRLVEAGALILFGTLRIHEENWGAAVRALEQAIEIGDDIAASQLANSARTHLALVNVYQNNLTVARRTVEDACKIDVPLSNHLTSAVLGLVALRQGDLLVARKAFDTAIDHASQLVSLTPEAYDALDAKGLSLCGLAVCGDATRIAPALTAYKAARQITSESGVIRAVLQRFDALAKGGDAGMLTKIRPWAANEAPQ